MSARDGRDNPRFGILFVGGIEHQNPGSAVASFSATLYSWLTRWNCGSRYAPGSPPALNQAVLSSGDEPAHLSLDVTLPLSSEKEKQAHWLVAESAWPSLVTAPSFGELARWIWKVSTCLLVLQFVIPMRRHLNQVGQATWYLRVAHVAAVLSYLLLMLVAAMLSVLTSMVLLLLAVAARLPIPQIDQAVRWTVVKISSVLGDTIRCSRTARILAACGPLSPSARESPSGTCCTTWTGFRISPGGPGGAARLSPPGSAWPACPRSPG